jgi:hypothetical protein
MSLAIENAIERLCTSLILYWLRDKKPGHRIDLSLTIQMPLVVTRHDIVLFSNSYTKNEVKVRGVNIVSIRV